MSDNEEKNILFLLEIQVELIRYTPSQVLVRIY